MTAKVIVIVRPGAAGAATELFQDLGIRLVPYALPGPMLDDGVLLPTPRFGLLLERLETIIARVTPDQFGSLQSEAGGAVIESVTPDWLTSTPMLRTAQAWGGVPTPSPWALAAMGVTAASPTGNGAKVAVLDSGFDPARRGFDGPDVVLGTAVGNLSTADAYGHGTHCAALVGGNEDSNGNRFGVAPEVALYSCKVMYGAIGEAAATIAGIEWALLQRVHVILIAQQFSTVASRLTDFEAIAARALAQDVLIIAAAGNTGPKGTTMLPAAAASVVAVGATTQSGVVYPASSLAGSAKGAEVDLAAPGEGIYSAIPGSYLNLSGTSMAAAHVAGIAALWIEQHGLVGQALWNRLIAEADLLKTLKASEAGAGIVQAP